MSGKTEQIVLKVLNGTQFGAEINLDSGTYTFGSGDEADLYFADHMMSPIHGTLKLGDGKIELRGEAGALSTASGLEIDEGAQTWHEIAQLDAVTAGTTRFALGSPQAAWQRLVTEVDAPNIAAVPAGRLTQARKVALPAAIAAVAIGLSLFAVSTGSQEAIAGQAATGADDEKELVITALDRLPFSHALNVNVADDGRISVEGYVDDIVQRRAVREALAATTVAVAPRIWALDVLQSDVDGFLETQNVQLAGTVSRAGELQLTGMLLDDARLAEITETLSREVFGLAAISENVRSATDILEEANGLIENLRLRDLIILRINEDILEATGVVPVDKIDNWVGFVGSYSKTYVSEMPLRSYVSIEGKEPSPPIVITLDEMRANMNDGPEIVLDAQTVANEPAMLTTIAENRGSDIGSAPVEVVTVSAATPSALEPSEALLERVSTVFERDPGQFVELIGLEQTDENVNDVGRMLADGAENPLALAGFVQSLSPRTMTRIADYIVEVEQEAVAEDPQLTFSSVDPIAAAAQPDAAPLLDFVMGNQSTEFEEAAPQTGHDEIVTDVSEALIEEERENEPAQEQAADGSLAAARLAPVGPLSEPFLRLLSATELAIAETDDPDETNQANLRQGVSEGLENMSPVMVDLVDEQLTAMRRGTTILQAINEDSHTGVCGMGGGVRVAQLPAVLFWMDYLSLNPQIDLAELDGPNKALFFEVAMSPKRIRRCLENIDHPMSAGLLENSVFLKETAINDRFAEFLFRNVPRFELDMVGINLTDDQYVQLRNGNKLRRGMAPNLQSRIAMIGDLGLIVRVASGYEVSLYDDSLTWLIENN